MLQALSLNIFCHFLLAYKVFAEKSAANLWFPIFMMSCFCFAAFKNLFFFHFHYTMIGWISVFIWFETLCFLYFIPVIVFCISDGFFLVFFKSLLTFSLNSSIPLLSMVNIFMTASLNSLFSKLFPFH